METFFPVKVNATPEAHLLGHSNNEIKFLADQPIAGGVSLIKSQSFAEGNGFFCENPPATATGRSAGKSANICEKNPPVRRTKNEVVR